jgi:hypothetical protein
MKTREMTPAQIREAGFAALVRELGVAGALRFLRDSEVGSGDYTAERQDTLPEGNVRQLVERIRRTPPAG